MPRPGGQTPQIQLYSIDSIEIVLQKKYQVFGDLLSQYFVEWDWIDYPLPQNGNAFLVIQFLTNQKHVRPD